MLEEKGFDFYICQERKIQIKREWGKTPNGNDCNGRWVLRSLDGTWLDTDRYFNDIVDRHDLTVNYRKQNV